MSAISARLRPDGTVLVRAATIFGLTAVLALVVVSGQPPGTVAAASAATLALTLFVTSYQVLLRWTSLASLIVLLIMFIPIKRYKLLAGLPFDLEPYRIAVGLVALLWIAALLVDRRVHLRRSVLDAPLLLILVAILGSILSNIPRISQTVFAGSGGSTFIRDDLSVDVLKKLLFLLSFYAVYYFVVSVINEEHAIHAVLKTIVVGATVVAFFGIVEARTGYNVFDHVRSVLPILRFEGALTEEGIARGGRLRVYASSQHPIALATMFVMVMPLALYMARYTHRRIWLLAAALIGLGAISTVSRTSITAMAAAALVFLVLRPVTMKRLWPLLLPALLVIHLALPGAIGGIRQAFFPSGGLIQNQTVYGGRASSERLAPEFQRIKENPVFGAGYGTRITDGTVRQNARILDNEWLGTASETGLLGLSAWVWLFARLIRRTGREAKRDQSSRGWLLVALASAALAFAVGMLTYDAFSFIQVTFVLFILAALSASTLAVGGPWPSERGVFGTDPPRLRGAPE